MIPGTLLWTSCSFTAAMYFLIITFKSNLFLLTFYQLSGGRCTNYPGMYNCPALNPHFYAVYFVIKGVIVRPNPNVQYRPIFASGQENSFKEVLSVTSKISSSPWGFLSFFPVWLSHGKSVCFNLQPCNLLSISLSPLPTPGSLHLMKDFFVVHSKDDTKSKIHQSGDMFHTTFTQMSRIGIG